MLTLRRLVLVALVLALVLGTLPGCGGATGGASDIDFFKGKTVTIVTPHGAGGGFDIYARMIAPYLQKYLPESTVVVDNVTGAGGLLGRNKVFTAKPDGLTLGFSTGTGMVFAEWAEQEGVQYKMDQFTLLGRIFTEPHVMAVSAAKSNKTLKDVVAAKKITMGFSGVGSDDYYVAQLMAKAMGFTLDPITGYTGASEANLACVKGEVDSVQLTYGTAKSLIDAKSIIPVLVYTEKRIPELPDVPTIIELTSGESQKTMLALIGAFEVDRIMFAPPNMPAGTLKVLREALDKAFVDAAFQADSAKAKRPVLYLNGEAAVKQLQNLKTVEASLRPQIKAIASAAK